MSMPRAAMSVATSTRILPALKFASALRFVAVDCFRADVLLDQMLGDAIRAVLRAREHEHALHAVVAQHVDEQRALVALLDEEHFLLDLFGGRRRRHDRDRLRP